MLHETPVLVAFAVSLRSHPQAKLASASQHVRRTISPASAASTSSSSSDSAIGTTSPLSAASVSPSGDHPQQLHIVYAIQSEDLSHGSQIHEVSVTDMDADIAEITRRIGPQALLISTTEDLRQILHPTAALHVTRHCNVGEAMDSTLRQRLPPVFSQYVSVDTLQESRLTSEHYAQMSTVDRCRAIMGVVNEMNLDLLNHVETINEGYTPFVNFDRRIDSSLVVRTRGLPWQASDQDIALFFAGLNIAPGGIALCLGSEGRRNGESLVCFESNGHRELALRRHRKFLHNRYIEVYRSTGEEFNSCFAMGTDSEALKFVCRDAAMIIRMRGLPFDCTEADIRAFFGADGVDPGIMEEGVMFVNRPDGRPIGDAFVLFVDDDAGRRALLKHKNRIGSRYIELFRTTQAEVQQIINRVQQRPATTQQGPVANSTPVMQHFQGQQLAATQQQQIQAPQMSNVQFQSSKRDCLRMRGLPYEAKPEQIAEFLGHHSQHIVDQGIHMIFNNQGSPSGEAFIQMRSEQAANLASLSLHNKNMEIGKKRRYIEVFQCSLDEMNNLLNPMHSLANQLNLPLGLAVSSATPLVQLPTNPILPTAANIQLPPHLNNMYRNLQTAAFAHPMQHLPMAGALGFAHQHQLNLLGIPTSFGAGISPLMFGNDPQLYTAATHLQQQQQLNAGLLDPLLLQQQLASLPSNGLDIATAAALLHHQQALLANGGVGMPLKDYGSAVGFMDLKQKLDAAVHGPSLQHHC